MIKMIRYSIHIKVEPNDKRYARELMNFRGDCEADDVYSRAAALEEILRRKNVEESFSVVYIGQQRATDERLAIDAGQQVKLAETRPQIENKSEIELCRLLEGFKYDGLHHYIG